MVIKYELSAAGVSVDSLLEQIATSTEVQTEQYKLLKESSASYIKMADNVAIYTKSSIEDTANGMLASGMANIVGSLSSIAITSVSLGVSLKLEDEAFKIAEEPSKIESEITATSSSESRQLQPRPPETPEQIKAREAAEAKRLKDIEEAKEKRKLLAQQKSQQANLAFTTGKSLADSTNGGISGAGQLMQGYYKQQEATDESLKQFYNNMPSIWNTIFNMQNGTISTQEQNKQSDLGVWAAIVQASTAAMRG